MRITLGSLFDGIAGFPYAASLYGIKTVWASEIEDAPIRITKRHFPDMKHLGDITKINGAEVEPVDIITFGSPCFPAGTLVLTETGYKPIEDIHVGDMVLTHKNRWKSVTAVGNRQAETIILKGNCTLETTRNHPIYSVVLGDTELEHKSEQWVRAEDMLGRYWATPRLISKDHRVFADTYEAHEMTKSVALAYRYYLEYHKFDSELVGIDGTYRACVSVTPSIQFDGLNHLSWYKVTSIEPTNQVKTVYNISVEEDESYIADSIVVHNCQSLSTAGHKHGISVKCANCGKIIQMLNVDDDTDCCPECGSELEFTRSGLFMDAIRIIREMREHTDGLYPKIAVFENVSGALSNSSGDDFFVILNEFCKLIGERVPKIRPEKWLNSGEILGDRGSIAWRLMDAQYWGVPQRRKRIFLVADFRGQSASEILFKPESLRRHSAQSETPWERTTGETGNCTECGDTSRKHLYNNVSHRLK